MDSIVRGLVVYTFLLIVFRLAGKRTLSQATNFDFVLLLILSETVQQAMINGDHSITSGFLLVLTLVGTNILLSFVKQQFPAAERWLDGVPIVIVENGRIHQDRLHELRIDEEDILSAARTTQGIESIDEIKHAVVERSGEISVVPKHR
jgi:uncharacterized membrane protein YcaP (DUF421 family)